MLQITSVVSTCIPLAAPADRELFALKTDVAQKRCMVITFNLIRRAPIYMQRAEVKYLHLSQRKMRDHQIIEIRARNLAKFALSPLEHARDLAATSPSDAVFLPTLAL